MVAGLWHAAVFDLDGTLVDTAPDLHRVLAGVMEGIGREAPDPDAVRAMVGEGARVLLERALAASGGPGGAPPIETLLAEFIATYTAEPCRDSRIFDGLLEVLGGLEQAGTRLGVCTNKPQGPTEGLLRALGLAHRFGAVYGGDALPVRKPDPAHLAAVLADLEAPPSQSVMIGDSRTDLLTARALGVPCVLVSFGYTTVPARELGADAVIDSFAELPAALARLRPPA